MSAPEPERRDRQGLFAPLGVLLIVSGIVVIIVAAFANPVVATAGLFLIASGIGLVVASEYRDEADMEYSRLGGLRLTKKRSGVVEANRTPIQPRNRDPTRRAPGCRLAKALNRRRP